MQPLYAHTPGLHGRWHLLDEHLRTVAATARHFAEAFEAGEIAYWIGLWHDIGKCNPKFQEYLIACAANPQRGTRGPDHKAAGTTVALKYLGALALLIQGHHGGLKDGAAAELRRWLQDKTDPATSDAIERAKHLIADLEPTSKLTLPPHVQKDRLNSEFFLRMVFSTLVDADFLDTERHSTPDRAAQRSSDLPLSTLWERFEANQLALSGQRIGLVAEARHAMYQACLQAADFPPGLFRLAIPTGGGKTRSAMAFALRHALRHEQRRIIVAVPFISITEQTADTYRAIFGSDDAEATHLVVLEHHSGASQQGSDSDDFDPAVEWTRLAAENWDAPIIVTTTVQLFESMFANKTSRCRKLHRLARSVIILDEAQALPASLLTPILDGLRQLCAYYGATVVLSTATQPAFDAIPSFQMLQATDIIPDAARWFTALKRVDYEWRIAQPMSWSEVAERMRDEYQALTIVNTKKDALALLDAVGDDALHLSTLLCGAHRRKVIAEVKRRLANGEPCHLVSTQVIEAGVDLDFPLVLRAKAPLDSIIQAAGRCNREGRLRRGRVVVFNATEGSLPQGTYSVATAVTSTFIDDHLDPDDPAIIHKYFQRFFDTVDLDAEKVQSAREQLNYPETAQRFRMIKEDTEDVVVAYGEPEEQQKVRTLVNRILHGWGSTRLLLRQIQPYLVSIPTYLAERYRRQNLITPIIPGLGVWHGTYDMVRGITEEAIDRELSVV